MTRSNTLINMCRQGEQIVVERLGKFHKVVGPGYFFAVPLIDRLAYVVDTRERGIDARSLVSSADGVGVAASGQALIRFVDAEKAAYGSSNPYLAIKQAVQMALRNAVAKSTYDEAIKSRPKINSLVEQELRAVSDQWGAHLDHFAVTDIGPENRPPSFGDEPFLENRPIVAAAAAPTTKVVEPPDAATILKRANASADAIRIHAQANADAIAIIAKAIDANGQHAPLAASFVLAQHSSLLASDGPPLANILHLLAGTSSSKVPSSSSSSSSSESITEAVSPPPTPPPPATPETSSSSSSSSSS